MLWFCRRSAADLHRSTQILYKIWTYPHQSGQMCMKYLEIGARHSSQVSYIANNRFVMIFADVSVVAYVVVISLCGFLTSRHMGGSTSFLHKFYILNLHRSAPIWANVYEIFRNWCPAEFTSVLCWKQLICWDVCRCFRDSPIFSLSYPYKILFFGG